MIAYRPTSALLFTFLTIAIIISASARKDQGEYWVTVTKETLIPESETGASIIANELIKGKEELAVVGGSESKGRKRDPCDQSKGFSDDFEPRPNVSAYGEADVGLKGEHKHFADDFEPRPNVSAYGDDVVGSNSKQFTEDFEPRPNVSAYGEDEVDLKVKKN